MSRARMRRPGKNPRLTFAAVRLGCNDRTCELSSTQAIDVLGDCLKDCNLVLVPAGLPRTELCTQL